MKMTYVYILLIVAVTGGLLVARHYGDPTSEARTTKYDSFAECLSAAGAKFYGAFWCPHCKEQKDLFENSAKLPYVECSTPNAQAQLQVCIDQKVSTYPTWRFADGSELTGVRQFSELAEKTSCEVPTT